MYSTIMSIILLSYTLCYTPRKKKQGKALSALFLRLACPRPRVSTPQTGICQPKTLWSVICGEMGLFAPLYIVRNTLHQE